MAARAGQGGRGVRQAGPLGAPAFNNPSQPVVAVCWHEARAYCAWLSAQTGTSFRLPSEAEWEAAARGREGRQYAYPGDFDPVRCNTFESHIRRTTPVGLYAEGSTPEGIADLTGNVWDWTSSAYLGYPYEVIPEREDPRVEAKYRVVRGGSWDFNRADARAAYRNWYVPGRSGRRHRLSCCAWFRPCPLALPSVARRSDTPALRL